MFCTLIRHVIAKVVGENGNSYSTSMWKQTTYKTMTINVLHTQVHLFKRGNLKEQIDILTIQYTFKTYHWLEF